jgi:pyruvate formate-lyase activating enzyme-like uncharacterized protein
MILEYTQGSRSKVHNRALVAYADRYLEIYADFMSQVLQTGIEIAPGLSASDLNDRRHQLVQQGVKSRSNGNSLYSKWISPSCLACRTGVASQTFFISLQCHRDCFFCFNPNQEDYDFYTNHTRDVSREIEVLSKNKVVLEHIALTGGEPLMHLGETLRFFKTARKNYPRAYTRLYTSGDHASDRVLMQLEKAGLQEIRFSVRILDSLKAQQHTLSRITSAKEFIPYVVVEMPVLPDRIEKMKNLLLELDAIGISGINLLEFCYPLYNAGIFSSRGYKVKSTPFKVLYNYWYAGGLPVAGSEEDCLDLLAFARDRGLEMGVHYCSLENKHSAQVYLQNFGQVLPETTCFSQKDFFIKSAKAFGTDIPKIKRVLDQKGLPYRFNRQQRYLEFHPKDIKHLKDLSVEIGISTGIVEQRGADHFIRELKLDYTTPELFDFSEDLTGY